MVDKNLLMKHTYEWLADHDITLNIYIDGYSVRIIMTQGKDHIALSMSHGDWLEIEQDPFKFRQMIIAMYERMRDDRLEKW